MPILSKKYYDTVDFEKSTLEPPMASGAYRVSQVDANRSITYSRVKDYWGSALPARKGNYNFDTIRFDIYRDETVGLEAFKAGEYDFREEYIARNWATAYDNPAIRDGRLIKKNIPHTIPRGMQGFVINLRKEKFKDVRVREAIGMSLDFEWMNRALFYDAYERNDSFFQNTPFAATGLPSDDEITLLEPFRTSLPPHLFTEEFRPPKTDGSGNNRDNLLRAQTLLYEAGWKLVNGKRIHEKTGEQLTVEFMMRQRTFERVIAPMRKDLARLGIDSAFRLVDDSQYQKRVEEKDFDIISQWWNIGIIYPGNEQRQYWHSSQANISASNNLSGMQSPVVDALLEKLERATTEAELRAASRALDRVLLWNHVFIPHWHVSSFRVAYWDKFVMPKLRPSYGLGFDSWWIKQEEKH
jgi:microcin C transport system substrate-binding protein